MTSAPGHRVLVCGALVASVLALHCREPELTQRNPTARPAESVLNVPASPDSAIEPEVTQTNPPVQTSASARAAPDAPGSSEPCRGCAPTGYKGDDGCYRMPD